MTVFIWSITDREQNHITFITLHILQVLDEYRFIALVRRQLQIRMLGHLFIQIIFYQTLLHLAERDNTYTVFTQFLIRQTPNNFLHNRFSFSWITTSTSLVVSTLKLYQRYLWQTIINRREGVQSAVIILRITECNQAFMLTAIVPSKITWRDRQCNTIIQNAVHIINFCLFFVNSRCCKETGRRHLHWVTHYHQSPTTSNSAYCFAGRHLWCFIEYYNIKFIPIEVNILCYRNRTHQHTRTKSGQQGRYLVDNLTNSCTSPSICYVTFQDTHLRGSSSLHCLRGNIRCQAAIQFLLRQFLEDSCFLAIFINQFTKYHSIEHTQMIVAVYPH